MENGTSIGELLRRERESRSLSLDQVHDSTKITAQNLSALEEDRFDAFPNKVYARAFLRDYANYLGLDSASLLTSYEEKWGTPTVVEPVIAPKPRRSWRRVGWALLVIVLLGGIGAAGYIYRDDLSQWAGGRSRHEAAMPQHPESDEASPSDKLAELPPAPQSGPEDKPETTVPETKPAPEPVPAAPEKLKLEVAAFVQVWIRLIADGNMVFIGTLEKGERKTFEANDTLEIRAGKAGGVQLKLNGVLQPPLGSLGESKTKKYTKADLPVAPTPALPAGTTAVPPAAPPATPAPGR